MREIVHFEDEGFDQALDELTDELVVLLKLLAQQLRQLPAPTMCVELDEP